MTTKHTRTISSVAQRQRLPLTSCAHYSPRSERYVGLRQRVQREVDFSYIPLGSRAVWWN